MKMRIELLNCSICGDAGALIREELLVLQQPLGSNTGSTLLSQSDTPFPGVKFHRKIASFFHDEMALGFVQARSLERQWR